MYYIINENQQIIASDNHFLKHCNVSDITALTKAIHLEKILLDIHTETTGEVLLTLQNEHQKSLFSIHTIALSSLIGSLSLITLNPIRIEETESTPTEEIEIEELIIHKETDSIPHVITDIQKEIFSQEPTSTTDTNSIFIDISKISHKIGISKNDYHDFFNDYVSTALFLEKDLRNHANHKQIKAIETLLHLGNILHLEPLQKSIIRIQNASMNETSSEVSAFYEILSKITLETSTKKNMFELDLDKTTTQKNEIPETENKFKKEIFELDLNLSLTQPKKKKYQKNEPSTSIEYDIQNSNKVFNKTLDLSNVQPIHFDFSLSMAADELALPENLIKEFMLDFISQTHKEIGTMLEAYRNANLKIIQETAHLLKSVSSNLRINILSDTLNKIQFCNDLQNVEPLIKDFWGHFLSFETQINLLSQ